MLFTGKITNPRYSFVPNQLATHAFFSIEQDGNFIFVCRLPISVAHAALIDFKLNYTNPWEFTSWVKDKNFPITVNHIDPYR